MLTFIEFWPRVSEQPAVSRPVRFKGSTERAKEFFSRVEDVDEFFAKFKVATFCLFPGDRCFGGSPPAECSQVIGGRTAACFERLYFALDDAYINPHVTEWCHSYCDYFSQKRVGAEQAAQAYELSDDFKFVAALATFFKAFRSAIRSMFAEAKSLLPLVVYMHAVDMGKITDEWEVAMHSLLVSVLWDLVDFCAGGEKAGGANFEKVLADMAGVRMTAAERSARLVASFDARAEQVGFRPWSFRDHGNWAAALGTGYPPGLPADWALVDARVAQLQMSTRERNGLRLMCEIRSALCLLLSEDERPPDLFPWEMGHEDPSLFQEVGWTDFTRALSSYRDTAKEVRDAISSLKLKGRKRFLADLSKLPDIDCIVPELKRKRLVHILTGSNLTLFAPTVAEIVKRAELTGPAAREVRSQCTRLKSSTGNGSGEEEGSESGPRQQKRSALLRQAVLEPERFESYVKGATDHLRSGNLKMAAASLSKLMSCPELSKRPQADVAAVGFCLAYALAENPAATASDLEDALKVLDKVQSLSVYPVALFLRGQIHCRRLEYEKAEVHLEKLAEILRFQEVEPLRLPGSEEVLAFSTLANLRSKVEPLLETCRNPPSPDRRCFWHECRNKDIHFFYRFKGYNEVTCSWKCRFSYHPDCFKAAVEDGQMVGHEVTKGQEKGCPTPDCEGVIARVAIYKSDRSLKTSYERPRQDAAAMSPKKKTARRKTKSSRDNQKGRKQEPQTSEDGPSMGGDTGQREKQPTSLPEGSNGPSVAPCDFSRPNNATNDVQAATDWILAELVDERVVDVSKMRKLPRKHDQDQIFPSCSSKREKQSRKRRDKSEGGKTILLGAHSYIDSHASGLSTAATPESNLNSEFQLNPAVQGFLDRVAAKLGQCDKLQYSSPWLGNCLTHDADVGEAFDKMGGWLALFGMQQRFLCDEFGLCLKDAASTSGTAAAAGGPLVSASSDLGTCHDDGPDDDGFGVVEPDESKESGESREPGESAEVSAGPIESEEVRAERSSSSSRPARPKVRATLKPELRARYASAGGPSDPGGPSDDVGVRRKIKARFIGTAKSEVAQGRLQLISEQVRQRFRDVYSHEDVLQFLCNYRREVGGELRGVAVLDIVDRLTEYMWSVQTVDACAICLVRNGTDGTLLPCGHRFHAECIRNWVAINRICPVCRKLVVDPQDFPPLQ